MERRKKKEKDIWKKTFLIGIKSEGSRNSLQLGFNNFKLSHGFSTSKLKSQYKVPRLPHTLLEFCPNRTQPYIIQPELFFFDCLLQLTTMNFMTESH